MSKRKPKPGIFERCHEDGCKGHAEIIVVFTECQTCKTNWRFDRADDDLGKHTVHFTREKVEPEPPHPMACPTCGVKDRMSYTDEETVRCDACQAQTDPYEAMKAAVKP